MNRLEICAGEPARARSRAKRLWLKAVTDVTHDVTLLSLMRIPGVPRVLYSGVKLVRVLAYSVPGDTGLYRSGSSAGVLPVGEESGRLSHPNKLAGEGVLVSIHAAYCVPPRRWKPGLWGELSPLL